MGSPFPWPAPRGTVCIAVLIGSLLLPAMEAGTGAMWTQYKTGGGKDRCVERQDIS